MEIDDIFEVEINYQNKLPIISNTLDFEKFKKLYIQIRSKENRLLDDETVKKLPYIDPSSPYYKEWKIRAKSMSKLVQYLKNSKPKSEQTFLDVGCGNGWLSSQIADNFDFTVIGCDINQFELEQGFRVFDNNNLHFVYYNILDDLILPQKIDYVLFASSIQYFSNIVGLFSILFNILKPSGEIHVIDSPLYHNKEVKSARRRSRKYYKEMNIEGMIEFYHHHKYSDFEPYHPIIKYNGSSRLDRLLNRIGINRYHSPFPWLIIKKNKFK